jgi:hypothetical protein
LGAKRTKTTGNLTDRLPDINRNQAFLKVKISLALRWPQEMIGV